VLFQFGTPGSGEGQFNGPSGITAVASRNWVADTGNNRIETFTGDGVYLSQFGAAGSGNGQFNGPSGIARLGGELYVVDTGNNRVEKFTLEGVYLSQFGTAGSGEGQFNGPSGIAIGPEGSVYVADTVNNRIQKFTSEGVYVSQFGTAGSSPAQFNGPSDVTADPTGNVYVVDAGNGRVQKFTSEGNFISVLDTSGSEAAASDSSENVYVLDHPNGSPSQIHIYNSAGALTYSFEAGDIASSRGLAATGGSFAIRVSDATNDDVVTFTETTFLPLAVTEGAFAALATTATLAGTIKVDGGTTRGADTTYRFEYGPTTAYGQSAPVPEGDLGSGPVAEGTTVSMALTGLARSTTYHYRLVATNSGAGGSGYGADHTFTTVVLAPAVDTGRPTVAATAATLTGGVLPQGVDTTYHFEYGATTSYGATTPVPDADAGSGTTPQPVTQDITGLTPNTTYHYRLVATSIGGTTYGADQAFTTYASGAATGSVSPFGAGVAPPAALTSADLSGLQPTPAAKAAPPTIPRPKCKRGFRHKKVHGNLRCVKQKHPKRATHKHGASHR
jgi:hypothetical protein